MDYGSIATNITNGVSNIENSMSGISSDNFNGYWTGSAHDNLTNRLNIAIKNLEAQLSLASSYANALKNLDYYKSKGIEISRLDYNRNASKIKALQTERATLKQSINNVTSQIKEYKSQEVVIKYSG